MTSVIATKQKTVWVYVYGGTEHLIDFALLFWSKWEFKCEHVFIPESAC